jgi:hypothetical protein
MTLPQDYRDEVSTMINQAMQEHVTQSALLSAGLGILLLALFVEGLLRLVGVIPPFMGINISVMP